MIRQLLVDDAEIHLWGIEPDALKNGTVRIA